MQGGPEIVLNLWYVMDDNGLVFSLRAKPYVCEGSDEMKLDFLRERAMYDYLVAQSFDVPKKFCTVMICLDTGRRHKVPATTATMVNMFGKHIDLFENALKK